MAGKDDSAADICVGSTVASLLTSWEPSASAAAAASLTAQCLLERRTRKEMQTWSMRGNFKTTHHCCI